jgi:toxin-antitoxin system PIN domain toxin
MTSFFPDVNVWLALTVTGHSLRARAWGWFDGLPEDTRLVYSRFTQLGLLRLLTNPSAMGGALLTLGQALEAFDLWSSDPRVEFSPEPRDLDRALRGFLAPFAAKSATKWIGDCYLLAFAEQSHSRLVTFDEALHRFARKHGHAAVLPT